MGFLGDLFGTSRPRRTTKKDRRYIPMSGLQDPIVPDRYMTLNRLLANKKYIPFYATVSPITRKGKAFAEVKWVKTYSAEKLKNYGTFDIEKYPAYSSVGRKVVEAYLQKNFQISLNKLEDNPDEYASTFNEKYREGVEKMTATKVKPAKKQREPKPAKVKAERPPKAEKPPKVKAEKPVRVKPQRPSKPTTPEVVLPKPTVEEVTSVKINSTPEVLITKVEEKPAKKNSTMEMLKALKNDLNDLKTNK